MDLTVDRPTCSSNLSSSSKKKKKKRLSHRSSKCSYLSFEKSLPFFSLFTLSRSGKFPKLLIDNKTTLSSRNLIASSSLLCEIAFDSLYFGLAISLPPSSSFPFSACSILSYILTFPHSLQFQLLVALRRISWFPFCNLMLSIRFLALFTLCCESYFTHLPFDFAPLTLAVDSHYTFLLYNSFPCTLRSFPLPTRSFLPQTSSALDSRSHSVKASSSSASLALYNDEERRTLANQFEKVTKVWMGSRKCARRNGET